MIGLASVRVRSLPFLGFGVAYVAGGPLVDRGIEGDLLRFEKCLEGLREEYVQRRKLVLRVLPPIGDDRWNQKANQAMAGIGMANYRGGREYRTFLLDLQRPLQDIRKGLAQKWRNCLNRSEKEGLTVSWTNDLKAFEQFQADHELFVKEKGFSVDLDAAFYKTVGAQASAGSGLELALVKVDGKPVATHMGSYIGDTAVYVLGLTDEIALKKKAAYFLHWEVIKRAHQRGMKWYDLGGIDPEENPGVFKFKAGLRGKDVQAAGPMELAPNTLCRFLLHAFEKAARFKRSRR